MSGIRAQVSEERETYILSSRGVVIVFCILSPAICFILKASVRIPNL